MGIHGGLRFSNLSDFSSDSSDLFALFLHLSVVGLGRLIKLGADHSLHGLSETLPLRFVHCFLTVDKNDCVDSLVCLPAHLDFKLAVEIILMVELLSHLVCVLDLAVHHVFVVLRDQSDYEVE